ncbi:MAG: enolase C-terminal domain-like protein, partial [Pseudomonadota bacterium]|nr:enolase C-terminal domain-like protein [Pseudomonadota bacterium]
PDFIEQPVRAHDYETMAKINRQCPVLLLADESVFGPEDVKKAISQNIAGGVSIKVMKSGGIKRARKTAQIAAKAGWSCYGGDMHETGLGHLPGVHLIASCPEITLGCEFYHARYYVIEDILSTKFPIDEGHVVVPDSPGLGFSPDIEKIDALSLK